jgi:phosphoglycolate phosphatase
MCADAVLFDIEGTLITTGGADAVAWRLAFNELYEVPATITDAGNTDSEVGRLTFRRVIGREPSPRELADLMAVRLEYLPLALRQSGGYRVLPGVHELLTDLAARGYLLGLTTGSVEAAAHFTLARGRLNRHFSFGGYGSDSTRRAIERATVLGGNGLTPSRCLVVGDTPIDIAATKRAGAVAVGVASGRFSITELADAGADHVLESLEEPLSL